MLPQLCARTFVAGSSAVAVTSAIGTRLSAVEKAGFALILMWTCCGYLPAAICNPEAARENVVAQLNGYLEELLLAKCADLENAVEESCTVGDYCKRIYSGGTPSTKIPSLSLIHI